MKLSIIVPVYQVEKYIVKCVSSLLNQDFCDYEIIVVDDGSKDDSIDLLQKNIHDSRVSVVHQENRGLSAARNRGLVEASGDYIWFFDSDDWLEKECLGSICQQLDDCDILSFMAYFREYGYSSEISRNEHSFSKGKDLSFSNYWMGAPFYIYRRAFLKEFDLCFYEGIYHEDLLFTPCALYLAKCIARYSQPVYHRLIHSESITQNSLIMDKRCMDVMTVIAQLEVFNLTSVAQVDQKKWRKCIISAIVFASDMAQNCSYETKTKLNNYLKKNKEYISYCQKSSNMGIRLYGYAMILLPWTNYVKLYRLLRNIQKIIK